MLTLRVRASGTQSSGIKWHSNGSPSKIFLVQHSDTIWVHFGSHLVRLIRFWICPTPVQSENQTKKGTLMLHKKTNGDVSAGPADRGRKADAAYGASSSAYVSEPNTKKFVSAILILSESTEGVVEKKVSRFYDERSGEREDGQRNVHTARIIADEGTNKSSGGGQATNTVLWNIRAPFLCVQSENGAVHAVIFHFVKIDVSMRPCIASSLCDPFVVQRKQFSSRPRFGEEWTQRGTLVFHKKMLVRRSTSRQKKAAGLSEKRRVQSKK